MKTQVRNSVATSHASTILDSIADGVFTVDKDMVITYFNRSAERITGVPRKEAMGQYCFEVLRSNICERTCALKCTFQTGEDVIDRLANILRTDGTQVPISISTTILRDRQGNVVGGVETFRDLSTIEELKKEIVRSYTFQDIISKNHKILDILDILPNIAESESTVLIQGASGAGKELFAQAIHHLSHRRDGPFLAINCGALPDTLLESELFGYVKGAFTDAKKDKPGRFALAAKGTIFLDEVESLTPATQVKLLRVLQEREYTPLGATAPLTANVRVIAATKDNLSELVKAGRFRDDLYFRLDVVRIELPPLVERRDDIPLLVKHFIEKFNRKMGRRILRATDEVLEILMQYDFPGNIRQLENFIEHAFVMCRGEEIQRQHLPPEILSSAAKISGAVPTKSPIQNAEAEVIRKTLAAHNANKDATARALGMHRTTLWRKMKKYGLS